jgi:hypothetical protein
MHVLTHTNQPRLCLHIDDDDDDDDNILKYFEQSRLIEHSEKNKAFITIYTRRLTLILKSKPSGWNLVKAISTCATCVLTYYFAIVSWTSTDLEKIQTCTRSFLKKYHFHHPTFAVERVTLLRKYVGRGLKTYLPFTTYQYSSCTISWKKSPNICHTQSSMWSQWQAYSFKKNPILMICHQLHCLWFIENKTNQMGI